jgi:Na+/melibiose symporter-like transporter
MDHNSTDIKSTTVNRFRRIDYFNINIFGFALNAIWNPMSTHIMPLIVLGMVAESSKNTYLGIITVIGLLLAMIVQPVMGAISDRTNLKWGRRKPFILAGTIASVVFLLILGKVEGIVAVGIVYCLLQIATNTAHGPWQGYIPDMVPEEKRGIASGVKSLIEILGAIGGIYFIGMLVSRDTSSGYNQGIFLSLSLLALIMAICMIITVTTVREPVPERKVEGSVINSLRNTFRIDLKTDKSFIYFLVSRLIFLLPLLVLRTFGLYYISDIPEITNPVKVVADLTIIIGIFLVLVVYPAGYLADKIGRKAIVIASGLVGVIGVGIMIFLHSYTWILVGGAFIGVANGSFMSASWAMATDLVNKGEEGRYMGLTNIATAGAGIIAAFSGPVIDWINEMSSGLGYQIVLGACIVLLLGSTLLVLKVSKSR